VTELILSLGVSVKNILRKITFCHLLTHRRYDNKIS